MPVAAGTSNLFFSRDTKVYVKQGTNIWEIPVQNGYSFSQTTNTSTITLNEMSDATGKSRRGQRAFNDSLSPAEWSFETYARPVLTGGKMRVADEILWASLVNNLAYSPTIAGDGVTITGTPTINAGILTIAYGSQSVPFLKVNDTVVLSGLSAATGGAITTGTVVTYSATGATISIGTSFSGVVTNTSGKVFNASYDTTSTEFDFQFVNSNTTTLGTFDLYFVLGGAQVATGNYLNDGDTTIYKIAECCVNEVTINFDIEGISTFGWNGMGRTITEETAFDASTAIKAAVYNGGSLITNNLIRNRLTALQATSTSPTSTTYTLAITGGSITITNNNTFLTPETLGVVNQPLGHTTGTRSVTGTFTCYLDEVSNGSKDLYKNLVTATSTITNKFNLKFFVGGIASGGTHPVGPGILFDMGQCHLEIPSITNDDVISLEANFTALPTSISGADEVSKVRFVGIAP